MESKVIIDTKTNNPCGILSQIEHGTNQFNGFNTIVRISNGY